MRRKQNAAPVCFICKTPSLHLSKVWSDKLGMEIEVCPDCVEDWKEKAQRKAKWDMKDLMERLHCQKLANVERAEYGSHADERLLERFRNAMRFMKKKKEG